jgi:TolB-like protein/DNA-binding winged helix-turn-helix (wHTH) protein
MASSPLAATCYRFGRFTLEPDRRALSADGAPVVLSSRALDILLLLVEHRDRTVTKDELLREVWHGLIVEENNLAVQISALRRALGPTDSGAAFIATIPAVGYRFVGRVDAQNEPAPPWTTPGAELLEPPSPIALTTPQMPALRSAPRRWWPLLAILPLFAGLGWGAYRLGLTPDAIAPRLSLVVLPFHAIDAAPGQGYLADAITDDLTTDLSHLPGSTVIARESASAYRGRNASPQAIGRALNVRYLLQGALRDEGGSLHINAELIDSRNGAQLWASAFDTDRSNLDTAREAIVRHLSAVLGFTLVQIEGARSLHERPHNPDAVDLFLRARSRLDRDDSLEGLQAARALLEQAVAAQPDFSDALAELGLVLLREIGDYDDPQEWRDHERAVTVIAEAMAIAPQAPLVITARGKLDWVDDKCDQALPSFRLALSLDPDETQAQDGLARCQYKLGQLADMITTLLGTIRIDPAAPQNALRQSMVGRGELMLDHTQEAMTWLERAQGFAADGATPPAALGWRESNALYLIAGRWQSGDHQRARADFADYTRMAPHRTVWQLASYDTRALAALPGRMAFFNALAAVGMPRYADESQDFGVEPSDGPHNGGDFAPTPLILKGGKRIETAQLETLLAGSTPVRILDVGRGVAVPMGATLVWPPGTWGDPDKMLEQAARVGSAPAGGAREQPLVVLGNGIFGWSSYDAAQHFVASGYRTVLWYRGGEEAWAAARLPAQDHRVQ